MLQKTLSPRGASAVARPGACAIAVVCHKREVDGFPTVPQWVGNLQSAGAASRHTTVRVGHDREATPAAGSKARHPATPTLCATSVACRGQFARSDHAPARIPRCHDTRCERACTGRLAMMWTRAHHRTLITAAAQAWSMRAAMSAWRSAHGCTHSLRHCLTGRAGVTSARPTASTGRTTHITCCCSHKHHHAPT